MNFHTSFSIIKNPIHSSSFRDILGIHSSPWNLLIFQTAFSAIILFWESTFYCQYVMRCVNNANLRWQVKVFSCRRWSPSQIPFCFSKIWPKRPDVLNTLSLREWEVWPSCKWINICFRIFIHLVFHSHRILPPLLFHSAVLKDLPVVLQSLP